MPNAVSDWFTLAPIWSIGAALLGLMSLAFFGGRWLSTSDSRRDAKAGSRAARSATFDGFIVSAVLGLLALLLGFTFSLAINRYEERRQLVIDEANAIRSAYLRVQVLDSPYREKLSGLLVDYMHAQIDIAQVGRHDQDAVRDQNSNLLKDVWQTAAAALAVPHSAPFAYLVGDALTRLVSVDESRREVRSIAIPTTVLVVLAIYLVSVAGLLGYITEEGRGGTLAGFVLVLMNISLLLVIDIDRPTSGSIREEQAPMERLRTALEQHAAPPLGTDVHPGALR